MGRMSALFFLLAVLPRPAAAQEAPEPRPLTRRERVLHFLNRFSMGATPKLVAEVQGKGIRAWLDEQMASGVADLEPLAKRLAKLKTLGLSSREIMARYVLPIPAKTAPAVRRARQRLRNLPPSELVDSVVLRAVYNPRQVQEAAADFFRNHLSVAIDKGRVRYYATDYEREVIRASVFGSFGEMLRRSAHHPAMLVYLDNVVSRRPPTKAELKKIEMRVRLQTKSKARGKEASDIAAQRGLNENYARELLELHTLGVDHYYTQRDVENVAMTLTGWTVSSDPQKGHVFEFKPAMHYDGEKYFLGLRIARNKKNPRAEGEKLLEILAKHKGTAHFLSFKLCRYFVNDDPPADCVERIAEVWRKSHGDLRAVYTAIVNDPEFFRRRNYRAKFKRPFEFVVSALRATHAEIRNLAGIHRALAAMSEPLYRCKDPTGYYDQAEAWKDPGAFAVRWKFAMDLALGKIKGVAIPAKLYEDLYTCQPEEWRARLVGRILPAGLETRTARILDGMIRAYLADHPVPLVPEIAPRITGMILGSPEFQQQ